MQEDNKTNKIAMKRRYGKYGSSTTPSKIWDGSEWERLHRSKLLNQLNRHPDLCKIWVYDESRPYFKDCLKHGWNGFYYKVLIFLPFDAAPSVYKLDTANTGIPLSRREANGLMNDYAKNGMNFKRISAEELLANWKDRIHPTKEEPNQYEWAQGCFLKTNVGKFKEND